MVAHLQKIWKTSSSQDRIKEIFFPTLFEESTESNWHITDQRVKLLHYQQNTENTTTPKYKYIFETQIWSILSKLEGNVEG